MSTALLPRRPGRPVHTTTPPAYFVHFVTIFLQASPRLAKDLWRVFAPQCSQTTLFQLNLVSVRPTIEQQEYLATMLTPQALLHATVRLAPEGRQRPLEVRRVEAMILRYAAGPYAWR